MKGQIFVGNNYYCFCNPSRNSEFRLFDSNNKTDHDIIMYLRDNKIVPVNYVANGMLLTVDKNKYPFLHFFIHDNILYLLYVSITSKEIKDLNKLHKLNIHKPSIMCDNFKYIIHKLKIDESLVKVNNIILEHDIFYERSNSASNRCPFIYKFNNILLITSHDTHYMNSNTYKIDSITPNHSILFDISNFKFIENPILQNYNLVLDDEYQTIKNCVHVKYLQHVDCIPFYNPEKKKIYYFLFAQ